MNGSPIELVEPDILKFKVYEPILRVGSDKFANVDIRIRVKGGGHTSQIYAIRQALAKSIVAYYQKYVDEASKNELKQIFLQYDRTLLVADPRRCEPKKFGGAGARARYSVFFDFLCFYFLSVSISKHILTFLFCLLYSFNLTDTRSLTVKCRGTGGMDNHSVGSCSIWNFVGRLFQLFIKQPAGLFHTNKFTNRT